MNLIAFVGTALYLHWAEVLWKKQAGNVSESVFVAFMLIKFASLICFGVAGLGLFGLSGAERVVAYCICFSLASANLILLRFARKARQDVFQGKKAGPPQR